MTEPDQTGKQADEKKANGTPFSITVNLRKAVNSGGEDVKELTFREPTAADIERAGGNPVLIDTSKDPVNLSFDAKSMTAMMSLLASVPPSTIRQMHPKDWNNAAWQLASFFTPDLSL